MEKIDLNDYHKSLSSQMGSLSAVFDMVFKKQVKDMDLGEKATPEQVDLLSEKVSSAMEFFAGPRMKKTIKRLMKAELRKRSLDYFKKKYGI